MEDKKVENLNKSMDDEVTLNVVDAKELSDEAIEQVAGGTDPGSHECMH